ncbi:MAG: F0F1 ATP synthase subunit delta [Pararhodobacter sp.]|nr:F0F1 ATP synthase subunit delta [Pararhodobacter sp.]
MSEPASISSGIAARYATAVFDLASEAKALKALEADIAALQDALAQGDELARVIASPIYSRADQGRVMAAIAEALELSQTMRGALGLMAQNRRLFVLPQLLSALHRMIAEHKGEVSADITSATVLTKAQADALAKALKAQLGKSVKLNVAVDEALIGGLVVQVGSTMIDTSIRAKLAALQNRMKEVG